MSSGGGGGAYYPVEYVVSWASPGSAPAAGTEPARLRAMFVLHEEPPWQGDFPVKTLAENAFEPCGSGADQQKLQTIYQPSDVTAGLHSACLLVYFQTSGGWQTSVRCGTLEWVHGGTSGDGWRFHTDMNTWENRPGRLTTPP